MFNILKIKLSCCFILGLFSLGYSQQNSKVVIQVDIEFPTQDKPQSKLWYMHNTWWTILPTKSGPSIWKRTGTEAWELQTKITQQLKGLPGRADIQVLAHSICAVVVDSKRLSVVEIDGKNENALSLQRVSHLSIPDSSATIETATLSRTQNGEIWVTADMCAKVMLWHSGKDGKWSEPYGLGNGIAADDISVVTATSKEVHVIWSNQNLGLFQMRTHQIGTPYTHWSEVKTLGTEKNIADDHINIKVNKLDDIWMVTKNSFDKDDAPVFDLWSKQSKTESWQHSTFAPLTSTVHPSRPVVILTESPDTVFVGYTIYSPDKNKGIIQFAKVNTANFRLTEPEVVIYSTENMINDITTSKQLYPMEAQEWIILASDKAGRVYEANLKKLF